jgi:hypothetical protein
MIVSEGLEQAAPSSGAPATVQIARPLPPAPRSDIGGRIERWVETSAFVAARRTRAHRFRFTIAVVAIFAVITWAVRSIADTGPGPLSPMILAVCLATWYGGIWQGLLAAVLGAGSGYLVMSSTESFGAL